jgi:hypothetical protein
MLGLLQISRSEQRAALAMKNGPYAVAVGRQYFIWFTSDLVSRKRASCTHGGIFQIEWRRRDSRPANKQV